MLLWSVLALSLPVAAQTLSGVVYRDYDGDGTHDTYEDGVADIDVAVYDASATLVGSGITADDGTFNLALSVGAGTNVRVTFSNIPSFLFAAPLGTDNRGTVVFAQSGDSDIDLGLQNPGEHCQATPTLAATCFIYGEQSSSTSDTLVTYSYTAGNNGSSSTPSDYDVPAHLQEAGADEIGATFGLAYQGASNSLFVAAYMKRHSGFGPDGVGAIYRVDRDTANVSLFVDLDALFPGAAGTDPHPFGTDFDTDGGSWDSVGKLALGGMDLSEDQQTLYVMNLADRQLYALPIGLTPTAPAVDDISRFAVPTPSGCVASDVRPFAVRVNDGMVYVGVICSAESTGALADLDAVVYRFDPSDSSWTQVLRFDLDYTRGCANSATSATCNTSGSGDYQPAGWRAWRSAFDATVLTQTKGFFNTIAYAQPMLTDIDFARGKMVIGLRDRLGDQTGTQTLHPTSGAATRYIGISAGDLLIASADGLGGYTLEANGSVDAVAGSGVGNSQGPGGGEFFAGEYYRIGSVDHTETSIGSIAHVPGTNEILNNVFDPVINTSLPNNTTYDAGTHWYSLANGTMNRAYRVFNGPPPAGAPTGPNGSLFGKANGLGDLEPLCEAPTTQIGNRVWSDLNGNGIQDADEPGLAGVTVSLDCGMGSSTTMTDANGVYVFTVPNGASCDITIDLSDAALGGRLLTFRDAGSSDAIDSDAVEALGLAQITITAGGLGQNDHSYDFGFVAGASLGDFIWNDVNGDGLQTGEAANGFNNVTVDLVRDDNANGSVDPGESVIGTTATDAAGAYAFTDLLPGDYIVLVTDTNGVLTGYAATTTEPLAVALSAGNAYTLADFGYQLLPPGSIGDFVWRDQNGDGVQDPGEPGIANVTVDLIPDLNGNGIIDGGETAFGTDTTDVDGLYQFAEVNAGDYLIQVTDTNGALTGLVQTGGTQPHVYALAAGEEYNGADFGYDDPATASIGDYVWRDSDGDGVQDGGETGIAGVTLDLIDDANSNGTIDGGEAVLATDTTDVDGLYLFEDLDGGSYIVTITDTGSVLTGLNLTGGTQPHAVSLAIGEAYRDADFGYDDPGNASIGDFVWSDDDSDGVQDGGEPGFENVTLDLIADLNGNGTLDGGEPVLNTQTTDASGLYRFDDLDAGTYLVQVTDTNNVLTGRNLSGGTNPHPVTLAISQAYTDADFGYTLLADSTIGDTVYLDDNNNGTQDGGEPGIDGVTLDLIRDLNGNGTLDGGEPVLLSTTTAGGGLYAFESLSPGDYLVQVTDTGAVLSGYTLSGGTNPHAVTDLPEDTEYLDADFGYYRDRPVIGAAKRAELNGNHVTYYLVVENLGNVTLTNPSLTDNLDDVFGAGLWVLNTAPSFVVNPGSFTLRGDFNGTTQTELITAGGSLAAGATAEISFEVIVLTLSNQGHGNGVYYNQVTAVATPPGGGTVSDVSDDGSDPDPNGNDIPNEKGEDDPTIVVLTKMPLLTATKQDRIFDDFNKNGELDPGEQVEYTVVISNIGDGPAENVSFESGVDPNTDFEVGSVTTTQGTVVTGNTRGGPAVVVELGDMPNGTSATITFRATVHDPLPGGVTQIACQGTVNATNTPPDLETDDPDTGKPGDLTLTPLGGSPLIEATKADSLLIDLDSDGNADPGETLRYTVVITNTGTRAATEVVFDSGVDPKTSLVVGSVTTTSGTVSIGNTNGDTTVQVQIGDIAISGSVTVTFDVLLDEPWPPLETQVVCQGTVSGSNFPDEPTDDPDTLDDDDPTVTPVELTPVVTIVKTSEIWVDENGDGALNPGDTLRYTIVVHNDGPVTALAAVVTDTPDPNTTLLVGTVDTTVGSVTEGNSAGDISVEVALGDMAVDATETIHFQVLVTPAPGANQIFNQAFVGGDNFEQAGSDDPRSTEPNDPTEDVIVFAVPTLGETALLILILSMGLTAVVLRRKGN